MRLLEVAFIGCFWGILLGTEVFHHKTSKVIFMGLTWSATVLWPYIQSRAISLYGLPVTN